MRIFNYVHHAGTTMLACLATLGCSGGEVPLLEELDEERAALTNQQIAANTIALIKESNPRTTTHSLISEGGELGISAYGGGYINRLKFPNSPANLIGPVAGSYGRGGQSTLRDDLHSHVYNPTQAGFNETCGTEVKISPKPNATNPTELVLPGRRLALWKGDGKYDFTSKEDVCVDPYSETEPEWSALYGGEKDVDDYDDPGSQVTEVTSNFDYNGSYKTCESIGHSVGIPCFRHYFQYSYRRSASHHLAQFLDGELLVGSGKTPVLDPSFLGYEIEPGRAAAKYDMAGVRVAFNLRFDQAIWDAKYTFTYDLSTNSLAPAETGAVRRYVGIRYAPLVIVAARDTPDAGRAIAVYRPRNHINASSNLRLDEDGNVTDRFNRDALTDAGEPNIQLQTNPAAANGKEQVLGFACENRGIFRPKSDGTYESYHGEYFIMMGTPDEIVAAAMVIHPF